MPIYTVILSAGCDCTPTPDMLFRADDMVSAVMQAQEKVAIIQAKADAAGIELHGDITIASISEAEFELFDEQGIEDMIGFWKVVAKQ